MAGEPAASTSVELVLLAAPGLVLLYGGYRLPSTTLRTETYPRIIGWMLGGFGLMLVVILLLVLNPAGSVDRPFQAAALATVIGSAGGFAIGVNEARAISRAWEAEHHRDELHTERDLRERLVETSPVGIVVVNPDRSIRLANERAAAIVGLARDEILALEYDESMLDTTDAGGNPLEDGIYTRVLTTGRSVYDAERRMTRPDGRQIWLSVSGAPLRDPSGDVTGVIFAFEDITDRKAREHELEVTNERLAQFAHAASHDLQEPLRMVSTYLQLLEQQYGDTLDEPAVEYLDFAVDGADRMRAMIESLLGYSQVTAASASAEPTDVNAVFDAVLGDLQLHIEETGAVITADELPTVMADGNQLGQVLRNLLANALKYAGDHPPQIHVGVERDGPWWRFSVSDSGIGIDPKYHDQIFEVFERVQSADEGGGSGIGLALCQRIIEQHGGEIWVESALGEGATFTFTLPSDPPDPLTSTEGASELGGRRGRDG